MFRYKIAHEGFQIVMILLAIAAVSVPVGAACVALSMVPPGLF